MSHIRLAILIVSLSAPAVAYASDGGVYLYLQPMPPEAASLTFTIASVSAVSATGGVHPLALRLTGVRPAETGRQRLLASGRLPTGGYTGFLLSVTQAAQKRESGNAALIVPDAPVRVDVPFVVGGSRGSVLWLTLNYDASVTGAFSFSPVFTAVAPSWPIADHAGFVSNSGSRTITVFDRNLEQAVASIETCAGPAGMSLDRHRRRLYVACSKDDEIQTIDVATGEVVERSRLSPGDQPREVALTPDGRTLVSVNTGSNSISFFEAMSLARHERLNVGSGPASVVIDADGRRAFVFNTLSSSLSVIDLASRSVTATLSMEAGPLRGHFNRRGDRLYVIHERTPYMTVLETRQLTTVTRARLRVGVSAIAVDTIRGLVCIGGRDRAVEFYDPEALMPLYAMKTPAGVSYMAFDAEDNSLYLVSRQARTVIVGRVADRKVVAEIDVGEEPYAVAVVGER